MAEGTEVNKNSTSYTSVLSPKKKKKKKKKEKKNKERVWGQTSCIFEWQAAVLQTVLNTSHLL